jgi:hypothetical protein
MTGGAGCEEKWTAQHTAWDRCPRDLTDSPLALVDAPSGLVCVARVRVRWNCAFPAHWRLEILPISFFTCVRTRIHVCSRGLSVKYAGCVRQVVSDKKGLKMRGRQWVITFIPVHGHSLELRLDLLKPERNTYNFIFKN